MRYFIDKYVTLYYSGNQKWDTPNTGPGDFTMAALVQRCRDRYNIFIMLSNPQISDIQKLYFLDMRSTQPIRRKVQYRTHEAHMRFPRRAVEKWRRDILILAGYLCNLGHSHVQYIVSEFPLIRVGETMMHIVWRRSHAGRTGRCKDVFVIFRSTYVRIN